MYEALKVGPGGIEPPTHHFLINYQPSGKRIEYFGLAYGSKGKRCTIGSFPAIGLADARDIAKKLKIRVALE